MAEAQGKKAYKYLVDAAKRLDVNAMNRGTGALKVERKREEKLREGPDPTDAHVDVIVDERGVPVGEQVNQAPRITITDPDRNPWRPNS